MTRQAAELNTVAGFPGVHVLSARGLRCAAIRLAGGDICLYSPLPDLDDAGFAALASLGEISILLAPNHYHHRGLARHRQRFPQAQLVCTNDAMPRLRELTGLDFAALGIFSKALPLAIEILQPPGLKTGEAWFRVEADNDCAWIVCDSFSAEDGDGIPSMLGTFHKFGVRDAATYRNWVKFQMAQRPPSTLVSCHGAPVSRPDLAVRLDALLNRL